MTSHQAVADKNISSEHSSEDAVGSRDDHFVKGHLPEERSMPIPVRTVPFVLVHLIPLLAVFTDVSLFDWALCFSLYFIRMFFVTAGYHRYFSHRTFKTSRIFQFLLAFCAETSAQKGALWWAAHHRTHHKHSDTPRDPHSMKIYGFWYSHLGWILGPDYDDTEYKLIPDLVKYPELRWLDKYFLIPPIALGFLVFVLGGWVNSGSFTFEGIVTHGWSTLLIGFFLSTVILYHGTFSINSLMHKFGKPRYDTGDESRNSWWLAILTLGEGWHNNHHYYQSAARQGFFWWEVDISYYVIRLLGALGLVWDIREVPHHVQYSEKKTLSAS
ncbi:MAG: acyl-CoA desaturase [Bdellovibrionales bacterium]|nr:acyl-CoA desaturase [Bdellovibrionales bacterium]